MYKAKFAFEGQEGEMTLAKDDLVELVEKDDNGWWLVKKNGIEGWAPNNYLELVPPSTHAAPPPPPRKPPPPKVAPVAPVTSVTANVNAKPVSVFPGMAAANGSATPWKKAPTAGSDSPPSGSRPSSALASKPAPPSLPNKPKPPAVGAKPSVASKVPGGKPPVPSAPRPPANNGAKAPGKAAKPATAPGQVDLAALVSSCAYVSFNSLLTQVGSDGQTCAANGIVMAIP